ncbi:MAG: SoxR reducing system RseC family protein [Mariprofundaceae bacterium]|nr:SoxR reducing system RseC family protein [Mariprofundaceae bacterium]
MEQVVTVVSVHGDQAVVRGRRASACDSCAGKASCGTLGSWVERFAEMRVINTVAASVGDTVVVEVPDGLLLRVAFTLYGLPMLVFLITGLMMRSLALALGWNAPEALAAAGGLLGVATAYAWIYFHHRPQALDARIVRIRARAVVIPVQVAGSVR